MLAPPRNSLRARARIFAASRRRSAALIAEANRPSPRRLLPPCLVVSPTGPAPASPYQADHTLAAGGLNRDDRDATSVRRHERTASRDLQASSHNPPFVRPPTPPSPTFGRGPERTSPKPPSPTNFVASLRESRRSPNSSQRQSPTPWHPQAERRQSPHALSGSPTYAEAAKARRPSGERPARPQSPFGKSPDPAGSARGQFARQKTPPRSKSTVNHYETDVAKARSATAAAARGKTPPARMSNNVGVERRERPPSPARANRTMVDASCQTRDESGAADGDAEVGDSFTSMIQSQSGLLMSLQAQMEMLAERGHSRGPKFGRDGDSDGEGDADVEVRSLSLSEDGPVIHNGAGHLSARRNAPDPVAMLSDGVHTVVSDSTSGGDHSAARTQKESASSQVGPSSFPPFAPLFPPSRAKPPTRRSPAPPPHSPRRRTLPTSRSGSPSSRTTTASIKCRRTTTTRPPRTRRTSPSPCAPAATRAGSSCAAAR